MCGTAWGQINAIRGVLAERYLKDVQVGVAVLPLPAPSMPSDASARVAGAAGQPMSPPAGQASAATSSGAHAAPRATPVFVHNADLPLMPASNLKILTSAAALDHLGRDFEFRTTLLYRNGDLYIIGDGDPTLGDPALDDRNRNWTSMTVFEAWAAELERRGIRQVNRVVVDDSIFERPGVHPSWPADQVEYDYVAQVAGLNFFFNCIDVRAVPSSGRLAMSTQPPTRYVTLTGTPRLGNDNAMGVSRGPGNVLSVKGEVQANRGSTATITVDDPSLYGATIFSETLARRGITVSGGVTRDLTVRAAYQRDAKDWQVVGLHSTPIATALTRCNRDSANLYAESLLKRLGAAVSGSSGSWDNGASAVNRYLSSLGLPHGQVQIDDGSGLSRNNRVTAMAMVRVLEHEFNSPDRDLYLSTLATPGGAGTLQRRFDAMPGAVFAKSGFIRGVSALSGYVRTPDGRWFAFSILMNGIPSGSNTTAKQLQERIVTAIHRSTSATSSPGR